MTRARQAWQSGVAVLVAAAGLWVTWGCVRSSMYQRNYNAALTSSTASEDYALARMRLAVAWRPDLSDGWRELSTRELLDDPTAALAHAQRAVRTDRAEWRNWQALGMAQLQAGNVAGARSSLEQAADLNHGFQSRYALGNLEIIAGDTDAARQDLLTALAMATPEGVASTVRELLQLRVDPQRMKPALQHAEIGVQARAVLALISARRTAPAARLFADMRCNQYAAVTCGWAATALVQSLWGQATQTPGGSGRKSALQAQAVWNQAVRQSVWPGQEMARPNQIVNGDFQSPWTNSPLNWVASGCVNAGERLSSLNGRSGLFFQFDGSQPDDCELIQQWVLTEPGQAYRLRFSSLLDAAGEGAGVEMRVRTRSGTILAATPVRLRDQWSSNQASFTTPAGSGMVEIVFGYHRALGSLALRLPVGIADVVLEPMHAG